MEEARSRRVQREVYVRFGRGEEAIVRRVRRRSLRLWASVRAGRVGCARVGSVSSVGHLRESTVEISYFCIAPTSPMQST